jgi:hypothetical protein
MNSNDKLNLIKIEHALFGALKIWFAHGFEDLIQEFLVLQHWDVRSIKIKMHSRNMPIE